MRHLTPREFAELIGGELPARRSAHLEACDACRATACELRETLRGAAASDVPEPSPLFWDHFSSRVADAIAAETPSAGAHAPWLHRPVVAWAASALLAALVLAVVFARALLPGREPPTAADAPHRQASAASSQTIPSGAAAGGERTPLADIDEDTAWALVRAVAEDAPWEAAEAAGVSARAGSAEQLALELTDGERAELARLIETELKQNGA